MGVTGILVTCSYNQQEFFRVGYYVNNYYEEPELNENPPVQPDLTRLTRHILVEKPRVTKFQIKWDDSCEVVMADQNNVQPGQAETGLMEPGTQFKDRNDMMSSANLQAAQNFFVQ